MKSSAGSLASRFHITKYPTLKVFRNGQPAKREYRGQRSVEAFVEYTKKQLEDPIKEFHTLLETHEIDVLNVSFHRIQSLLVLFDRLLFII